MNDYFPIEFLPLVVFCGILAIVGVILKQTLKHEAKKRHAQEPRLPYAKRA